jgi:hypothetical protein
MYKRRITIKTSTSDGNGNEMRLHIRLVVESNNNKKQYCRKIRKRFILSRCPQLSAVDKKAGT